MSRDVIIEIPDLNLDILQVMPDNWTPKPYNARLVGVLSQPIYDLIARRNKEKMDALKPKKWRV